MAFHDGPAEVLPARLGDIQLLPGAIAYIADIQDAGAAIFRKMAAGTGAHRKAIGVAQPIGPYARFSGAGVLRVKEGVAGQPVSGFRVDPKDLAVVIAQVLSAVRPHVLVRAENAPGDGPTDQGAQAVATNIGAGVAARIAGRDEQRAVFTHHQGAQAVKFKEQWNAIVDGFPQQYGPAVRQCFGKIAQRVRFVAGYPANRGLKQSGRIGMIGRRAKMVVVMQVQRI